MSTAVLQLQVQRHRFAHHAFSAVVSRLPQQFRTLIVRSLSAEARPTATARSVAQEAQQVREMALAYQRTDPGFAADLFAAAARHEGQAAD